MPHPVDLMAGFDNYQSVRADDVCCVLRVLTVLTCWPPAPEKAGAQKVALYVPNCYGASSCWGVGGQAGQANPIKLLNNNQRYMKNFDVTGQCVFVFVINTMFQQIQWKNYLVSPSLYDDTLLLLIKPINKYASWESLKGFWYCIFSFFWVKTWDKVSTILSGPPQIAIAQRGQR